MFQKLVKEWVRIKVQEVNSSKDKVKANIKVKEEAVEAAEVEGVTGEEEEEEVTVSENTSICVCHL